MIVVYQQIPKAGPAFATFCDYLYTFYFWAAIRTAMIVSMINVLD